MRILVAVFAVLLLWFQIAAAAVNINTASEEELEALPGIGPVKAKEIVKDRRKNGPFRSVGDIKRVKGIGETTFQKLKGAIVVRGVSSGPNTDNPYGNKVAGPGAPGASQKKDGERAADRR